ncbi:hypothetical protein FOZ62_012914, partial [Perkinsus olseni]
GAKPNLVPRGGFSVLYIAAQSGDLRFCRLLIESGADPNRRAANGETAIFGALGTEKDDGRVGVIKILLAAGAERALECGMSNEVIGVLVGEGGAVPDAVEPETGDSTLMRICRYSDEVLAVSMAKRCIDDFGANVN